MNYDYQYVKFKATEPFNMPDGSEVTEFLMSTQQADLGYGSSDRKILNKGLTIGDIRYQIGKSGVQEVQNTTITFSNVGQFYHSMRELNSDDFWSTLSINIYWADGRVPTLIFDGSDWLEDGETIVSFTPTETYPLVDSIKKEFEGSLDSASITKDKISISLVSKSKQDSYLVGSIESFNGADSSRSLISPIVLGDLTDENAFVPLILKNAITSKSTGICSDVPLSEAPTAFIYDDENEKFHQVINDQEATNENKQIEFYNKDESSSFVNDGEFTKVIKDGDVTDGPALYTLPTGEVTGYFTTTTNYVLFEDYQDPLEYEVSDSTDRFRSEGTRDNNNDGIYTNGTETGFLVDEDMAVGIAKINLLLFPVNIKTVDPLSDIPIPTTVGHLGFEQDPLGPNDFLAENSVVTGNNSWFGSFKNFVNHRTKGADLVRDIPTYENDTESLWLTSVARGGQGLSDTWVNYNYTNKTREAVTADFDGFKYDSDVVRLDTFFYGAVYKDWEFSDDSAAFAFSSPSGTPARSYITLDTVYSEFFTKTDILHDDSSVNTNEFTVNGSTLGIYDKLSDFYANPPRVTFNGFSSYNPVKSSTPTIDPPPPANSYLDRADPSFYGSSRFALDGMRVEATVRASVESKYWCFKGKTGDEQTLNNGLDTLATRYGSTLLTSRDSERSDWLVAGAHTGNPIYYRDLLAKIADEFRVFITDKNGASEIVSMGLSSDPIFTVDEGAVFAPWNDNVSFGETSATEIYNKIVIRYAKNHMTDRYGKTVSISADEIQRTSGVTIFDNLTELQGYLLTAKNTLAKINVIEKTKTIDLDWIRDDYTANKVLEWWCLNSNKQRATIKANVSKLQFINAQIGDAVDLDLPSLPLFYQVNYQITKIVNKSDKTLQIELEEIEATAFESVLEIGGKVYETVIIDELEWMSENLAFASGEYQYPSNDIANVEDFGLLYNHTTALDLIPTGWRLPTVTDFRALIAFVGDDSNKKLSSADANQWPIGYLTNTDDYGWSAQSGGIVRGDVTGAPFSIPTPIREDGVYFSSTVKSPTEHYAYIFGDGSTNVVESFINTEYPDDRQRCISVRYVRDV